MLNEERLDEIELKLKEANDLIANLPENYVDVELIKKMLAIAKELKKANLEIDKIFYGSELK